MPCSSIDLAGTVTAATTATEAATHDGYAANKGQDEFEGRYNPDAYLTWELEVEQHFACLRYPEHLHVSAATCEFIDFSSFWWSEHCRC
jgi:hypothetical protein